jgi:tripartite-type tricarboxylate transporter receptor subunit TctC
MSRAHRTTVHRRLFASLLAALVLTLSPAWAWPERPVKLIVTFPPGTANDISARIIADGLGKRWQQPVVIENRAGAEGTLGVATFVSSQDDHTLLYTVLGVINVSPLLIDNLGFDVDRDLAPIVSTVTVNLFVAVHAALPVRSLADLVRLAKDRPGTISWASGPSLPRFAFAAFLKRHGLDMTYVVYRDAAQPQADLGEGRIQVLVNSLSASQSPVDAGKARYIAVANAARAAVLPDVPTAREAGFPELNMDGGSAIFGRSGMDARLRDRIAADVSAVLTEPDVRKRLEATGQSIAGGTHADLSRAIAEQRARVAEISKVIDLRSAR